ncbi:MAG TPA: radical SAM protein [Acidimicrobiia bacterium]|nr:radical SAM protein [Acidimicrobiia bacterium]
MRIALIAMSGVRAYNPELTALGLSLPGFVERGKTIASLPSLGLLTLAALTDDRHDVDYYEVDDIAEMDPLPECDLAAFSTFSAQAKECYALSDRFRAAGIATVIGGLHVTAVPDEALEHCDIVVAGEGEPVWRQVIADVESGTAARLYRPDAPFDLADAPVPRYDLLDPDRYNRLTVQTQRGCPWHCEFCASSILLSSRYKMKPVERVSAEIDAMKEIWADPFVELSDDNSFANKHHARDLVTAIGAHDVPWFTETDISIADDPALLEMMSDAGCREILVGFESPNPKALDGLETRRNWKRSRVDRYREAVEIIQTNGVALNACFILGLDGDGPEVFDQVAKFVDETNPFDVQITVLTPFPGTPLYARLLSEGRIITPGAWELTTLFDVNYVPANMTVEQLEKGLVDLGRYIYSEKATDRRRDGFKRQVAAGRERRFGGKAAS